MTQTKAPAGERVSEERLREMLAGLEGVTPGPWRMYGEPEVALPPEPFAGTIGKGDMEPIYFGPRNLAHIANCDPNTIRSLITELLALRGGATVKPLEWESIGHDHWRALAPLFGSIRVEHYGQGYTVSWSVPGFAGEFTPGEWETSDQAKAAAFEHYRNAILSCIEPLPSSTADAGRVGELEAALRNIAEGNLGDASWQANYDRIRQVARLALQGGSDA